MSATAFPPEAVLQRTNALFEESQNQIHRRADRLFAHLMVVQWLAGIAAALWISPKTWMGAASQTHWHVWAAVFLGGALTAFPVFLAWRHPGRVLTRHVIAVAQMLTSALLIHLTGGRIETHFHVFGSLAFFAFYRDWRVLLTTTVVVALDHMLRGIFWPQSVFGVLTTSPWRWMEHAGWVVFEDTFLFISIRQSLRDMFEVAGRRAGLEAVNADIENKVAERTSELTRENTERRQAQEALRKSEAHLQTVVDNLTEGVAVSDLDGQLLHFNRAALKMHGYNTLEECRRHLRDFADTFELSRLDGSILPVDQWPLARILRGENLSGLEVRVRHLPAGWERIFNYGGTLVQDAAGQPLMAVVTIGDITERKESQRQLAESEHRLRLMLEAQPECVKLVAADGTLLDMNPAGLKMVEADRPAEVIGQCIYDVVAPEHRAAFHALNEAVFRGESRIAEFEIIGLKGTRRWMETHACPFHDASGKISAQLAVSRDISARKEAAAELELTQSKLLEASRQAGMAEVATGVLHNVGNVLNSVNVASNCVADSLRKSKAANLARVVALLREHEADLGSFLSEDAKGRKIPAYLEQLAEHLATEQAAALKELADLQKNIEHIKDIVTMQQSYARVNGVAERLNVADLLEDALRMNASGLTGDDIHVLKEFQPVPPIEVEKHKVLQILVNLVRNARHACEDSGRPDKRVTLRVTHGDGRVRIAVTDNGVGILPENLTRIFAHGFTTKKDGHGFGLHSGALAAKEMGGSLNADSEGPGRGATFTLVLPLHPPEVAAAGQRSVPGTSSARMSDHGMQMP